MALQIAQMIISDVTSVTKAIGAMQTFDPPPDSWNPVVSSYVQYLFPLIIQVNPVTLICDLLH